VAHHDVDFVRVRIEVIQQALSVKRSAGAGDGNEDFHDGQLNTKRQTPNIKKLNAPDSNSEVGAATCGGALPLGFGVWSFPGV